MLDSRVLVDEFLLSTSLLLATWTFLLVTNIATVLASPAFASGVERGTVIRTEDPLLIEKQLLEQTHGLFRFP